MQNLWYSLIDLYRIGLSKWLYLIKNADMVIALFGSRLGTPTARATSGTIEEIEEMIKAGNANVGTINFYDRGIYYLEIMAKRYGCTMPSEYDDFCSRFHYDNPVFIFEPIKREEYLLIILRTVWSDNARPA